MLLSLRKNKPPTPAFWYLLTDPPENRLAFIQKLHQRCGDFVKLQGINKPTYCIRHPDDVKYVLHTAQDHFVKGGVPLKRIVEVFGDGVLTNQNALWHDVRTKVQPFMYDSNTKSEAHIITDSTLAMLNKWQTEAIYQIQPFDLASELMRVVLNSTAEILFKFDISQHSDEMMRLIKLGNRYASDALTINPFFPSLLNLRYRLGKPKLQKLLQQFIDQARDKPFDETNLLQALFNIKQVNSESFLTNQQILNEFKTLLITGHETTGTALAWTFYYLLQAPDCYAQLKTEIKTVLNGNTPTYNDLKNLPYLRQVISEAMRMHPPIWLTGRTAIVDENVAGFSIKKDSSIVVSFHALHHHPEFWSQPEKFDPERFSDTAMRNRPRHAYLPFGLGQRVCIGSLFAMQQAMLIAATLVQRCEFTLRTTDIGFTPHITLKPKKPLKVNVTFL